MADGDTAKRRRLEGRQQRANPHTAKVDPETGLLDNGLPQLPDETLRYMRTGTRRPPKGRGEAPRGKEK